MDNQYIDPKLLQALVASQSTDAERDLLKQQYDRINAMRSGVQPQYTRTPAALFGGIENILRQRYTDKQFAQNEQAQRDLNAKLMDIFSKYFAPSAAPAAGTATGSPGISPVGRPVTTNMIPME